MAKFAGGIVMFLGLLVILYYVAIGLLIYYASRLPTWAIFLLVILLILAFIILPLILGLAVFIIGIWMIVHD